MSTRQISKIEKTKKSLGGFTEFVILKDRVARR